MRLLDTATLELVEFPYNNPPPYAILSHTWGLPKNEVLYTDMVDGTAREKEAFAKLEQTARLADSDGLKYFWVDTCCIDKSSSAELQEAINSMFAWYENSVVCYAYLSDVELSISDDEDDRLSKSLLESRWFTRGWTLQELLAPLQLVFYSKGWERIGSRTELRDRLTTITGIRSCFLEETRIFVHRHLLGDAKYSLNPPASVAERMAWAANRQTSRPEDIAYSLMGLFSVNMTMLYGEGDRAFLRLQEEILKQTTDYSIFAWRDPGLLSTASRGLLAHRPSLFADAANIRPDMTAHEQLSPVLMTGRGLQIEANILKLDNAGSEAVMFLGCRLYSETQIFRYERNKEWDEIPWLGIILHKSGFGTSYMRGYPGQLLGFEYNAFFNGSEHWQRIFAPQFGVRRFPHPQLRLLFDSPVHQALFAIDTSDLVYPLRPVFISHPSSEDWTLLGWTTTWSNSPKGSLKDQGTRTIIVHDKTAEKTARVMMRFVPASVSVPEGLHNLREYRNMTDYYEIYFHVSEIDKVVADTGQRSMKNTATVAGEVDRKWSDDEQNRRFGEWIVNVITSPVKRDRRGDVAFLILFGKKER